MAIAMFLPPFLLAGLAALLPWNRLRPILLPAAGLAHAALLAAVVARPELGRGGAYLVLDPIGTVILTVVSLLYLICSFYAVAYLKYRKERSNRVFVSCFLVFLGLASLVAWSHHLGLTWVAIEGTTLATAPLIYFNKTKRSIEATWKYLLIGSVGIALALLGTFFLAYALLRAGLRPTLNFEDLLALAPSLSKPWLRVSFILLLVGYGTKMGLAPMQTWKPDAYGEAPGVAGAVLAGGVTSCAFLAFLRIYQISLAAGEGAFAARLLLIMGLLSMAVAGIFMIAQKDFKRMLAYSSVEHMGILMIGLGIGIPAFFGTLLHVMTNALAKGVLFLSAGNIHRRYGSKTTDEVSGALRGLPLSGWLFLAGFIAVTGSPPFGPFMSEFSILTAAFRSGNGIIAAPFLLFLLVVFIGMGKTVLKTTLGPPPERLDRTPYKESFLSVAPPLLFLCLSLCMGLYLPSPLREMLEAAARFLEMRP